MKNIFLIISFVSLCIFSCFGRNSVDENTYNRLVDYVFCRYVNQYINNKPNKLADETAGYEKIKKQLDTCKIETPLSFESLKELLKENHCGENASKFEKWKNAQKFSDDSKKTNPEIIDDIVSIDENELRSTITEGFIRSIRTELSVDLLGTKIEDLENSNRITKIFICSIIFLFIVAFLVFWFVKVKIKKKSAGASSEVESIEFKIRETIQKAVLESEQRIESRFKPQVQTKTDTRRTLDEKEFNSIVDEVLRIIRLDKEEEQKGLGKKSNELKKEEATTPTEVKFLKEREGLVLFKETSLESAYYELFNINGNKASYRFCGNEDRAIENYDAVLKDVFDDEKTYSLKAKKIIVEKEGSVELQPDGKWKIIVPAKIKFI